MTDPANPKYKDNNFMWFGEHAYVHEIDPRFLFFILLSVRLDTSWLI